MSSLSKENAERAAQHLLAAAFYVDTDPRRAHLHGVAASARAGRVGRVREVAGYAAYHAREFEIAIRELRAANRISGDGSMWPVLADSERGIGRPEKAVEMAKDPQVKLLDTDGQIEMKIVVAGARRDLKQVEAAVATLKCAELEMKLRHGLQGCVMHTLMRLRQVAIIKMPKNGLLNLLRLISIKKLMQMSALKVTKS